MTRRSQRLTVDLVGDLSEPCTSCALWELGTAGLALSDDDARSEKETWVSHVLLEWGSCGRIVSFDGIPAGHVIYAPAHFVPGVRRFASGPVSDDAVVMTSLRVREEFLGRGVGRVLVQAMVKDMLKRPDVRAIEAFGTPGGAGCTLPTAFLQGVGFKTAQPDIVAPRMRLDLRSVLTWRDEIEYALERLRGVVAPQPSPRPAADHRQTGNP
jgi:GNAT superfamily N-acetyltransferase